MKIRLTLLLLLILLIGIGLRLHNLSPFKIYPDSYQSLIVAENIHDFNSVIGYLGPGGLLYPDFFMWTRPGLPLLINIVTIVISNITLAAQIISLFSGILIIPASFFFIKSVFKSTLYGVAAAVLAALSFNFTIWSGFIMTETTGVLFMMLFLWSLFSSISNKTKLADSKDILTGLLFSFAILTRYEYLIISLPVIFLVAVLPLTSILSPKERGRIGKKILMLVNIFSVVLLCISVVGVTLFPIGSVFGVMLAQSKDLLLIAGIVGVIFLFFILFLKFGKKYLANKKTLNLTSKTTLVAIWSFALLIILQIIFGERIFLYYDISYIRNFVHHDFLISIFSLIGFTILLKDSLPRSDLDQGPTLKIFCLFSIVPLAFIYHRINPDMERYMTHLIPFLLIPSSLGLGIVIKKFSTKLHNTYYILLTTFLLIILQLFTTYQGLRYLHDNSWYRISYEEKSARLFSLSPDSIGVSEVEGLGKTQPALKLWPASNTILIASLPEAYYYDLNIPTQSINDNYPFIYMENVKDNPTLIIIVDMPMREIFPIFTRFVTRNLQKYKTGEYYVHELYHSTNIVEKEKYPVSIYNISFRELREKLSF